MEPAGPIGLIAGTGQLPLISAATMKATGRKVVVMGLQGLGDPKLSEFADVFAYRSLTRLSGWIRYFRKHRVREVVMIGGVRKRNIYSPFRVLTHLPDLRTMRIWYLKVRKDKRDNAVLLAVADELSAYGIELISSVEYLNDHLADDGLMTTTPVPASAESDVAFGWDIARQSAKLDIGQSLAVKERDIIAVEAIEGTDAMIRRAGRLCRVGGWVLIKVARPEQDMRFDVPTVGPDTIRRLKDAKCRCLVVEAGRTLIVDKPDTIALADKLKIAIVGKRAE